jgi:hypothetical protein
MKPTGDADLDRRHQDELSKELARLQRNKDRRLAREKMKKRRASQQPEEPAGGSPAPTQSIEKPAGTTRKCANCGQAGHIKTNKKYESCFIYHAPFPPRGKVQAKGRRRIELSSSADSPSNISTLL